MSAELPQLPGFLASTLKLSESDVMSALQTNFPRLTQSIVSLPKLTAAWDNLPNAPDFTRFDGTAITNVTGARDYFGADVIPMLAATRADFHKLDTTPELGVFPWLLLAIGLLATVYGLVMAFAFLEVRFPQVGRSSSTPGQTSSQT